MRPSHAVLPALLADAMCLSSQVMLSFNCHQIKSRSAGSDVGAAAMCSAAPAGDGQCRHQRGLGSSYVWLPLATTSGLGSVATAAATGSAMTGCWLLLCGGWLRRRSPCSCSDLTRSCTSGRRVGDPLVQGSEFHSHYAGGGGSSIRTAQCGCLRCGASACLSRSNKGSNQLHSHYAAAAASHCALRQRVPV